MTPPYMSGTQLAALNALREADKLSQSAAAHRVKMIRLCEALGVPAPAIAATFVEST